MRFFTNVLSRFTSCYHPEAIRFLHLCTYTIYFIIRCVNTSYPQRKNITLILQIGDTIVRANGETEVIESISYEYKQVHVYNFEVTGERDYFANGYSVHNK